MFLIFVASAHEVHRPILVAAKRGAIAEGLCMAFSLGWLVRLTKFDEHPAFVGTEYAMKQSTSSMAGADLPQPEDKTEISERIRNSSARPKSAKRSQQRKHSRAKIISAAIVEFKEKRFYYTTVDDICSLANISRATFYTHFRGKEEVLLEIMIDKHSRKILQFIPLLELDYVNIQTINDWLMKTFFPIFQIEREWLFSYYVVCDLFSEMANFFSDGRDEIIDLLALRFDAFKALTPNGQPDDAIRTRGHLELYKMEQFALHAVHSGLAFSPETFGLEVARSFLAYIESAPIGPAVPHDRSRRR